MSTVPLQLHLLPPRRSAQVLTLQREQVRVQLQPKVQPLVLRDKCLEKLDMRKDVQSIFISTPKKKQVMFFSATMGREMRAVCKRFMQSPVEVFIDDESKLTLHDLLQYYDLLRLFEHGSRIHNITGE